jgi:hypothetical protein
MFDYLFFGTLFLWYKDKDALQKILTTLNWVCGILYARSKTSSYFEAFESYLLKVPAKHGITIYATKQDGSLIQIDSKNVNDFDSNKFYARVPLHGTEKIIVFTDKNTLINTFDSLLSLAEKHNETFSNLMEATIKEVDVLPVLKQYTSNNHYYTDITGYKLKAGDLYNFGENKYLLGEEELSITTMTLETKNYKKEDELD